MKIIPQFKETHSEMKMIGVLPLIIDLTKLNQLSDEILGF